MYIVTTSQMQAAERAADASGLSYDQMMENGSAYRTYGRLLSNGKANSVQV